ncbi:helix-turn-helix domain-containing protein [Paenibacillus alvei]|nr:helix-turn-helix domain-containing protein [Paenibacillus alvei]
MGTELRNIGELIYDHRKKAGYTLDQLSALSGVPKGTISKIERGKTKHPELDTVLTLASSLSIPYPDVAYHYVDLEKRKSVLQEMLHEVVQLSNTLVIKRIAERYLACEEEDSYDLTKELYSIALSVADTEVRLALFELIAGYARDHGIQPYVAKALFQKYLIEREDFSKLDITFQAGIYLLNYINFYSVEEKILLHFKVGYHAYVIQLYEQSIELLTYVSKEPKTDPLMRARATLLICNSYYYLGDYFMAEQYLCTCKKYKYSEIQETVKLNEAVILGKKGYVEQAISQLRICLKHISPNNEIHVINELLKLYLQTKDIALIEELISDESCILNGEYLTPFKKSELALYYKLKAEYYSLVKRYENAIDLYIKSAISYSKIRAHKDSNECFYSMFRLLSDESVTVSVNTRLKEAYNLLRKS